MQRILTIWPICLPLGLALLLIGCGRGSSQAGRNTSGSSGSSTSSLEAAEQRIRDTVWAKEVLAADCGLTFDSLWDALNAATNKLAIASAFGMGEIRLGNWAVAEHLPHGIERREATGSGSVLSRREWARYVHDFEKAGWRLSQTEFRHNQFDTDGGGQPRQSRFYFSAHLTNSTSPIRASIAGDLFVDWAPRPGKPAAVKAIDATHLVVQRRSELPAFRLVLEEEIAPDYATWFDPLLLYDLDGDGLSEIILPAKNLVYRRQADGQYRRDRLCRYPPGFIFTAVIADFDGDGAADLLCATPNGLVLFRGSSTGAFDLSGEPVWTATPRLINPMALTCGDIDQDGDLDLFLGQYRVPTLGQILRPSYYDANDSHPGYLLLNDGSGHFTDSTLAAGLGQKRWRRVFGASFADLNNDGHLDLLVASDFAGLDLYQNDGQGHFADMTSTWLLGANGFGMSEIMTDFNRDGRLDILMMGMNSPTVDRLEHLNLTRPGTSEDPRMRSRMTFGNRLFLARPEGGFEQGPLGAPIARSGWSWSGSAFDFDNDGFPDVYVTNGNESGPTVRDYESEFWLHDIYVDSSVSDVEASRYFINKFGRTRGQGWSYGGYEKNRLYLNKNGHSFIEVAHLMGVALEQDSRCVVADDLDGDGRMDLLVTTQEVWPTKKHTLRVYRNVLPDSGNWIGFRFREEPGGSPVGARVTLHAGEFVTVAQIATGESFRSQHANTMHLGLGSVEKVDSVEIRWPGGQVLALAKPDINRYHVVRTPRD